MTIQYHIDGSVTCSGNNDPERMADFPGPRNSTAQLASVAEFFADDVLDEEPPAQ